MSRPTWARGLKQRHLLQHLGERVVAPHVGAWIETSKSNKKLMREQMSRPTWARGLKLGLQVERFGESGRAPRGRVD